MEKELHIGRELKRLDNEIASHIAAFQAKTGGGDLTRMQSWIIRFLYVRQGTDVYQKDIEAEFSIARSTATGILQLMEKKGYICRKSVARDARLKQLVLTDEGKQIHEQTERNFQKLEVKLREGISDEELELFLRIVQKMRNNMEQAHMETDRRRD
ncbi:MAG: MarR family winged helix-turn-helix transcriptional regulator [Oliverpabstia sp.]